MLLAQPMETGLRRPLKSVSLNINNTLYNGLRPAALMGSFHGIHHLALRFGENVDRRSYEKVLGAVGASLGAPGKDIDANDDDPFLDAKSKKVTPKEEWQGLRSLEVSFCVQSALARVGRDEVSDSTLFVSLSLLLNGGPVFFFLSIGSSQELAWLACALQIPHFITTPPISTFFFVFAFTFRT